MNQRVNSALQQMQKDFQAAFSAHQAGRLDEAKRLYQRVLRVTPADSETLYLLGTAFSQGGEFAQARVHLEKALALAPDHIQTNNNLGLTWKALGKPAQALVLYQRALELNPEYADAHNNAGQALELMGKLDEAETHLRRAIELDPDSADAHCNLGLVMKERERFEEAVQCLVRGLKLRPDHVVSLDYLGSIYKLWGRLDQALVAFDRAVALSPDSYSPRNNRATVLEELGRFDEALADYQRAAQIAPADQAARWNQAFLFLRQGMLERGWDAYEVRTGEGGQISVRFPYPHWDGASLKGKTVLIYAEQGLGDEILFASCMAEVIAKAKHCVIECTARLAPLFQRSFPTATVVGADRMQVGWLLDVPAIDVQVAAGSLPRFVRPTIDSFPTRPDYLVPDPLRVEHWRSRVALLGPGLKVGICWRSGLTVGERKKYYSDLTQWGEILSVPGVHFVNLQYGECGAELRAAQDAFGVPITVFDDINLREDIDDSAALAASMDLVISAATAVLEMAGAVGVDAYCLDGFGKQWSALGLTEFNPWHPRTRYIHQTANGDWDTQLALAAVALREKVKGHANEIVYVQLASGVEVAVNDSLDDLSHYVLKEQLQWFDAEYDFMLALAGGDMQIVDVGAGVGAYALPLARRLPGGVVHALAESAADTDLLMKSRRRNQLDAQLAIAIGHPGLSLDAQMDQHGLDAVKLVRLSAEMCAIDLLERSRRFFTVNSPLVMFGVHAGLEFDEAIPDWFLALGYGVYRLVPGLNVLAPCGSTDDLDVYSRYLFACSADQAARLERQGLLVSQPHTLTSLPGIDLPYWQQYLRAHAYAAPLVEGWAGSENKDPDWEVYWMALNLFALAKSPQHPAAERYACLQGADTVLNALLQEHANLPRLVSLCRIMIEQGKREMTVGILNQICELLDAGMSWALDEPFLALSDEDASMPGAAADPRWVLAMVLARRESWRAFSTYFTGEESLPALLEARSLGYTDDAVTRRIALITARLGQRK